MRRGHPGADAVARRRRAPQGAAALDLFQRATLIWRKPNAIMDYRFYPPPKGQVQTPMAPGAEGPYIRRS